MSTRASAILAMIGFVIFTPRPLVSTHAQGTSPTYVITDLGTLGGAESAATAINESGQVAGWAQRADGNSHAFFYDGTLHDLGTIGGPSSMAWGVNRRATVVGQSLSAIGNTKGFIYSAGVLWARSAAATARPTRSIATAMSSAPPIPPTTSPIAPSSIATAP